jgi:hypothetical protein
LYVIEAQAKLELDAGGGAIEDSPTVTVDVVVTVEVESTVTVVVGKFVEVFVVLTVTVVALPLVTVAGVLAVLLTVLHDLVVTVLRAATLEKGDISQTDEDLRGAEDGSRIFSSCGPLLESSISRHAHLSMNIRSRLRH